jgi:hypothetical protein
VVSDTRGLSAGPDEDHLEELQTRENENFDEVTQLANETQTFYIANRWNENGRVFIRQSYPLPATVLAVIPKVEVGQ